MHCLSQWQGTGALTYTFRQQQLHCCLVLQLLISINWHAQRAQDMRPLVGTVGAALQVHREELELLRLVGGVASQAALGEVWGCGASSGVSLHKVIGCSTRCCIGVCETEMKALRLTAISGAL